MTAELYIPRDAGCKAEWVSTCAVLRAGSSRRNCAYVP